MAGVAQAVSSLCEVDSEIRTELPLEMVLRCLGMLAGPQGHFATVTTCCALRNAANDDELWAGRLRQDFPLVHLEGKRPGSLHRTYRILAKRSARFCGGETSGQSVGAHLAAVARPPVRIMPLRRQFQHSAVRDQLPPSCRIDLMEELRRVIHLRPAARV